LTEKFDNLKSLIGNTPMLKIAYKYQGELRVIFAKAEYYNFSGSIKDRMALNILERAYQRQTINPGDIIVETTSGNTGIAFCAIGAYLGHPVVIYMPDWLSEERKRMMRVYGAELRLVSREQGGFLGCIDLTNEFAKGNNVFCPWQFDNLDNVESHFLTTAAEIDRQVSAFGQKVDAVVAGVGTGGTIMGLNQYFKPLDVAVHPLEPENSPTMSTGHKIGMHRIQGISDEFIPSIVKLNQLDSIIAVDDGDSIIMAQKLHEILGLGVGISSGANFLGAVKIQNHNPATVATVFADSCMKYLSTGLTSTEPVKPGFLSTDIELIDFEAIR
jgi:cysteine synthase A